MKTAGTPWCRRCPLRASAAMLVEARPDRSSRWPSPLFSLFPEGLAGPFERGVHTRHLLGGKHEHRGVVDVVHVIHEHVAIGPVAAGDMRKFGLAEIRMQRVGGIGNEVGAGAVFGIAPDVA